jgi:hypothetical protein
MLEQFESDGYGADIYELKIYPSLMSWGKWLEKESDEVSSESPMSSCIILTFKLGININLQVCDRSYSRVEVLKTTPTIILVE